MKKLIIPALVLTACVILAVVDAVIMPGYAIKSIIKIVLFLLIPLIYGYFNKEINIKALISPDKKGITCLL